MFTIRPLQINFQFPNHQLTHSIWAGGPFQLDSHELLAFSNTENISSYELLAHGLHANNGKHAVTGIRMRLRMGNWKLIFGVALYVGVVIFQDKFIVDSLNSWVSS